MRTAVAQGEVHMQPATLAAIRDGAAPKGDVLAAARIAGIMAAKRTPELIPLCHTLLLSKVAVDFTIDEPRSCVVITATVRCQGQTGVEMEALTAVSVAALTIYDMAKALEKTMTIEHIRLVGETGRQVGRLAPGSGGLRCKSECGCLPPCASSLAGRSSRWTSRRRHRRRSAG